MKLRSIENNNEIWLPVTLAPFSAHYEVSDQGNVKSFARANHKTDTIIKPYNSKRGNYIVVTLKVGKIRKTARLNRLVALAHIPNPDNLPEVNHENGDKNDNRKVNLKWCDRSYNNKHAYAFGLNKGNKKSTSKPVIAYNKSGEKIGGYPSVRDAARSLGIYCQNICAVLKGKLKQSKGYKFEYSI